MSCCDTDSCNTDLLEQVYIKEKADREAAETEDEEENEEEAGKSTGTKVAAKFGFVFCFAAVFFLACFDQ